MSLLSLGTDVIVLTVYSMLLFHHASEITQRRGTCWPAAWSRDWNQTVFSFFSNCEPVLQVTLLLNELKCWIVLKHSLSVSMQRVAAAVVNSGSGLCQHKCFTLKILDPNLGSAFVHEVAAFTQHLLAVLLMFISQLVSTWCSAFRQ